jgi:mono/diheme cytochrome c family protein
VYREEGVRFTSLAAGSLAAIMALASGMPASADPSEFPESFMADMTNIREGRELFRAQCGHCHGSRAYPGKAPRLRPDRYEPDFVFWAIKGGYGRMPSFDEHFNDEEVMQIVAFVKSRYFSQ